MSVSSSMRVYNLEYVYANLLIKLVYNKFIFVNLFYYSTTANHVTYSLPQPGDVPVIF